MKLRTPTQIQLPEEVRAKLVADLNVSLASTLDLALQVKQAHWNIRGPQFFARHELFDRVAAHLFKMADMIAERGSTLGGYAEGTLRLGAKKSELPEYDLNASNGRDHIVVLTERFGTYTKLLREKLAHSEELNDPPTADLYTECVRTAELDLWFLESHLAT